MRRCGRSGVRNLRLHGMPLNDAYSRKQIFPCSRYHLLISLTTPRGESSRLVSGKKIRSLFAGCSTSSLNRSTNSFSSTSLTSSFQNQFRTATNSSSEYSLKDVLIANDCISASLLSEYPTHRLQPLFVTSSLGFGLKVTANFGDQNIPQLNFRGGFSQKRIYFRNSSPNLVNCFRFNDCLKCCHIAIEFIRPVLMKITTE